MRPVSVVPGHVERDLPSQGGAVVRNEKPSRALLLHGSNESLDDGDTSRPANCSETLNDSAATAPTPKSMTSKLLPLVSNNVSGSSAGLADRSLNEDADRRGGGLLRERPEADDASGVVIDGDSKPPTEGPLLRQGKR